MTWENVPALLIAPLHGHRCVIYKGRLIVIGGFNNSKHFKSITEISLDQPYTRNCLLPCQTPPILAVLQPLVIRSFLWELMVMDEQF